jgi:hypothetical protein
MEVLCSNLDRDRDYPEIFRDLSQSFQAKAGMEFLLGYNHFQIFSGSLFIYHTIIRRYTVSILIAPLNNQQRRGRKLSFTLKEL